MNTSPQLNLVVLYSPEPERSVAFYEHLGLTFLKHRHGNGPEHHASENAETGMVFEIYTAKEGEAATRVRLGFQVANVDEIVARLAEAGYSIVSKPRLSEWGKRAVVADPDGNRVELTEQTN